MNFIGKWAATPSSEGDKSAAPENSLFRSGWDDNCLQLIISSETAEEAESISIECSGSQGLLGHETYNFSFFNYHTTDNEDEIVLTILQNFTDPPSSFQILRLGPSQNQTCIEYYKLEDANTLRVVLSSKDSDGEVYRHCKAFTRVENYSLGVEQPLTTVLKTHGWDHLKYWTASSLAVCELKVTCVKGIHLIPEQKEEVMWALDQPISDIKKKTYTAEPFSDPDNQLSFSIQMTAGHTKWLLYRTYRELNAISAFERNQDLNADPALVKSIPPLAFKSYVEFHRMVLGVENLFRGYFQSASWMSANHLYGLLSFFEIPQHLDQEQVAFVNGLIEEGLESLDQDTVAALKIDESTLPLLASVSSETDIAPPVDRVSSGSGSVKRQGSIYQSNSFAPSKALLNACQNRVSVRAEAASVDMQDNPSHPSRPAAIHISPQSVEMTSNRAPPQYETSVAVETFATESFDDPTPAPASPTKLLLQARRTYSTSLEDITSYYEKSTNNPIPTEIINTASSVALKIMPMDVVSSPPMKSSIAKGLLYSALQRGMTVVKHGMLAILFCYFHCAY
ncbi:hypothetical protein EON65_35775 [archaeon]|nr:MAG: hypothetical protein EON65_35775 [archaeon]